MIKFKKAFTLVEILVVVAIISLLSGIVMISVKSARVKATDAIRQTDIANISLALEAYYEEQSPPAYPDEDTTDWVLEIQPFMEGGEVPKDPDTGNAYNYSTDPSDGDYKLCATLKKDGSSFCKGPGDGN